MYSGVIVYIRKKLRFWGFLQLVKRKIQSRLFLLLVLLLRIGSSNFLVSDHNEENLLDS